MDNRQNNRKIIVLMIVLVLLIVVVGASYSFFVYNKTGLYTQTITGGKIQVAYNEKTENNIIIDNAYPLSDEEALLKGIEFEFTITGYNESDKDAYYTIEMDYGEDLTDKERFLDNNIKISLYENDELIFENKIYDNLDNEDLYYGVIKSGTSSENPISNTYKMHIWINNNVIISDTLSDDLDKWTDFERDWLLENYEDIYWKIHDSFYEGTYVNSLLYYGVSIYTTDEFSKKYANFKVNVTADLQYKDNAQLASCFTYNVIPNELDEYDIVYEYPIMTFNTIEENVETCKTNMSGMFENTDVSTEQDGYERFCKGTGRIKPETDSTWTLNINEFIAYMIGTSTNTDFSTLNESIITFLPVVSEIENETRYYNLNTTEDSVNACKDFFVSIDGDLSDAKDGYESFCKGNGTVDGKTLLDNEEILQSTKGLLIEKNVFTQIEGNAVEITNYNVDACGSDVWIPDYIEGYPVTRIADVRDGHDASGISSINKFFNNKQVHYLNYKNDYKIQQIDIYIPGVFSGHNISNLHLPKTIEYIGREAFANTSLSNVIIPSNVRIISESAFRNNNITKITIPESVTLIGADAFSYNPLEHVIIKGNSVLEYGSFSAQSENGDYLELNTLEYGGTCEELNYYIHNKNAFPGGAPDLCITSDNDVCNTYREN